jgi:hypothetical protein
LQRSCFLLKVSVAPNVSPQRWCSFISSHPSSFPNKSIMISDLEL